MPCDLTKRQKGGGGERGERERERGERERRTNKQHTEVTGSERTEHCIPRLPEHPTIGKGGGGGGGGGNKKKDGGKETHTRHRVRPEHWSQREREKQEERLEERNNTYTSPSRTGALYSTPHNWMGEREGERERERKKKKKKKDGKKETTHTRHRVRPEQSIVFLGYPSTPQWSGGVGERERGGGGRQTDRLTDRKIDGQRHRDRHTETKTERQTDRQKDRQRHRDRQRERDRERERETDRQTDRERQRQRQKTNKKKDRKEEATYTSPSQNGQNITFLGD